MKRVFILLVSLIYILYTIILILVKKSSSKRKKLHKQEEIFNVYAKKDSFILFVLVFFEVVLLIFYISKNPFIYKFNLNIPIIIRYFAIIIGFSGLILIGWASFFLDGEFSATIELKENHRLITNGPYSYIRHPIYSGFILMHIGITIALSNILIFFIFNGGLSILLIERIPREEKLLNSYFDQKCDEYCKNTGRFVPKKRKI